MRVNNPLSGPVYLARGLKMLVEPGLRAFVLVPLLINTLIFAFAIYALVSNFSAWVDALIKLWLPDWGWLEYLVFLLWPLFAVLLVLLVYYGFSVIANIIAAPFNGILAERVEQRARGAILSEPPSLWRMVPRAIVRELAKLAYFIPRLVLLFIIGFIPLINLATPVLWFIFSAWMMAIQYIDYPMDNNGVSFKQMKGLLGQRRWSALGFGSVVQLGMLVPLLNLILMPAAVIGATLFWVEEYEPEMAGLKLQKDCCSE